MERPAKRPRTKARQTNAKRAGNAKKIPDESLAPPTAPTGPRPSRIQARCPNPDCDDPSDLQDDEGMVVCLSCGTLVESRDIVNEVTFGETSAGAAVVQGSYVSDGQTHARTLGGYRGAGAGDSREVSEARGRDQINRLSNAIEPALSDTIRNQALTVYKLLLNANFIQGRQVQEVAAACLYFCCRRTKDNQILLMDFSEILQVSVYKLGKYYADIKKELCLDASFDSNGITIVQPEKLILKFARKLEFGDKLMRVCEDASKLMKRMRRDWMVTGRSPAGLCGACIILAARMNNFRRTLREVVYIVRVAGLTVTKRLEEFSRTKASELSVDDFRKHGHLLKMAADPPAYCEALARQKKKSASHRRDADGFLIPELPHRANSHQTPSEETNGNGQAENHGPYATPDPSQPGPSLETTPQSDRVTEPGDENPDPPANTSKKKKRGKQKEKPPPKIQFVLSPEDLLQEEVLEDEINKVLVDPKVLAYVTEEAQQVYQEKAAAIAQSERKKDAIARAARRSSQAIEDNGVSFPTPPPAQPIANTTQHQPPSPERNASPIDESPPSPQPPAPVHRHDLNDLEIHSDEFDSDPEVAHCVLNEREQKIKERIWVTHNEDWLRAQQAKLLKKTLDEANGVDAEAKARNRRGAGRKRRGRMGDGSLLEEGGPVDDPAEAARRMLQRHGGKTFSRHIDYDRLNELYGFGGVGGRAGSTTTASTSRAASEVPASERGGDDNNNDDDKTNDAPSTVREIEQRAKRGDPVARQTKHVLHEIGIRRAATGPVQREEENEMEQTHGGAEEQQQQQEEVEEEVEEEEEEGEEEDFMDDLDENAAPEDNVRQTLEDLGVDNEDDYLAEEEDVGFDEDDDDY